jgi:hypothetical protein
MMMKACAPWELLQKALPGTRLKQFEFELPALTKGADQVGRRFIEGVASTPAKDLQNETVVQKGMDLRYFLKHGYFNNDHKPGFKNKVGEPTHAEIKRIKDHSGKSVLGLWVEGYLWPKNAHQVADDIWELARALKASGSKRSLGFSIQGKVLERDGQKILKAWIQDVAITPSPVNTRTWMELVTDINKSWESFEEYEDACMDMCKSIDSYVFSSGFDDDFLGSGSFSEIRKSLGRSEVDDPHATGHLGKLSRDGLSLSESDPAKGITFTAVPKGTREPKVGASGKKYAEKRSAKETAEVHKAHTVQKHIEIAYEEMIRRGHAPDIAHRAAVAATARLILQ